VTLVAVVITYKHKAWSLALLSISAKTGCSWNCWLGPSLYVDEQNTPEHMHHDRKEDNSGQRKQLKLPAKAASECAQSEQVCMHCWPACDE